MGPLGEIEAAGATPGPEFDEFANALDNCVAPDLSSAELRARVLDLPRRFHENTLRRLEAMSFRRDRPRLGAGDMDLDGDADDDEQDTAHKTDEMKQLEVEAQTWDLLRRLLPLRHARPNSHDATSPSASGSESSLRHFLRTDALARERLTILEWLQSNATSGPNIDDLTRDLQQKANRGDIIAHGWLHTCAKIKLQKSLTSGAPSAAASCTNSDGAPLVSQLDPDVVTRQNRKLEPQDDHFERSIWRGCYEHLRRGSSLESIREWCQERTEMWRAISMSPMLLPADGRHLAADVPPQSLILWRRMCFNLARRGGSDDYERAVYGLLSGDIPSVEKVATSWDDILFANYNALVRTQIDNFLLAQCPPDQVSAYIRTFPSFDAVQFHGDPAGVEKGLMATLGCRSESQKEAMEPYKALQASLIAKDVDRHLYEQGILVADEVKQDDRSLLMPPIPFEEASIVREKFFSLANHGGVRTAAHVFILVALLRGLDRVDGQAVSKLSSVWRYAQENIVAAYTMLLGQANLQELIPLYCSILEAPRQFEVLSWSAIQVLDGKRRVRFLKLMRRVNIDVVRFVERQAAIYYKAFDSSQDRNAPAVPLSIVGPDGQEGRSRGRGIRADFFGDDEAVISKEEENVIRSLEWLLNVPASWPKAFSVGTRAYKLLLKRAHLLAVRRLTDRVQFGAIMRNVTGNPDESEASILDILEDADFWTRRLEESGCDGALTSMVMRDARSFRELEQLAIALDALETMGSFMELSSEAPPHVKKFKIGLAEAVKKMKDSMQPLLGNCLKGGNEGEDDDELAEIRQGYLPEMVLAYVYGLQFAGTTLLRDNLLECLELSNVVAERGSALGEMFIKAGRMKELVEAFAACSKSLAITAADKRATGPGGGGKKLREKGWSRDLWTVKRS